MRTCQCLRNIPTKRKTLKANVIQTNLYTLQWRHNGRDGVSNHQPHECLFNRLFKAQIKENINTPRHWLCDGNSPVTGEFPAQMVSNAENVSIGRPHHDKTIIFLQNTSKGHSIAHPWGWATESFIVARLREPRDSNVGILENKPTLLTISRLWRYCGLSNYRFNFLLYWYAPWVFFLGRQCAFVFPIYVRKYRK